MEFAHLIAPLRRPLWLLLAAFLSALAPSFVEARRAKPERPSSESPDDETLKQAQQALNAASAALAAGDSPLAYRRAVESFRLVRAPDALLVLGRVALAENRQLDAQDLMRRYLADPNLESASDSPDQKAALRITEQSHAQSAKLNILGDRGTLIFVDGRLVGSLPLSRPLLLSPSEHKVELERGERRLEDQLRVPVGRLGELRADLTTRALVLSVLPGVIVFSNYSGIDDPTTRRLGQVVEDAVHAERLSPLPHALALETAGEPAPGSCENAQRCLVDLARKCEADYLLRVRVKRPTTDWQLGMELIDVTVGEAAAEVESTCAGCAVDVAARQLAGLFGPLYNKASSRPRGQISLTSTPSDAEVLLDGKAVGKTPYQATAWAGQRMLLLRKLDYLEEKLSISIAEGQNPPIAIPLRLVPEPEPAALAPPPPPPKAPTMEWRRMPRPKWRLGLGISSMVVGAVTLGFGASALAVNGQCIDSPPSGTCRQIFNTLAPGVGLTVTGLLVLGVGTGLVAWPGPRQLVQTSQK